jgi:diguanylate cyclase (GGDEF)-like protein/PAS domain S-box-containing protein
MVGVVGLDGSAIERSISSVLADGGPTDLSVSVNFDGGSRVDGVSGAGWFSAPVVSGSPSVFSSEVGMANGVSVTAFGSSSRFSNGFVVTALVDAAFVALAVFLFVLSERRGRRASEAAWRYEFASRVIDRTFWTASSSPWRFVCVGGGAFGDGCVFGDRDGIDAVSFLSMVSAEDFERLSSSLASAAKERLAFSEEFRLAGKASDSGERWYRISGFPAASVGGETLPDFAGFFEDVTKERLARSVVLGLEEMNAAFMRASPIGMAVYDRDGDPLGTNEAFSRLLGDSAGQSNLFSSSSWSGSNLAAAARRTMETGAGERVELVRSSDGGGASFLSVDASRFGGDGCERLALFVFDVTEKRSEAEALRERNESLERMAEDSLSEMRLALAVVRNAGEGVVVTDDSARIVSVNPSFERMTGWSAPDAIGRKMSILRSDRHDSAFYAALWRSLSENGAWSGELWNRRKDGALYLQRTTITAISGDGRSGGDGSGVRYVTVFADVTEEREADERFRKLAFQDPLTGLPNRRLLMDRASHAIEMAKRSGARLALAFIDLNGFKGINDRVGHAAGDAVLAETARRLCDCVRSVDTVSRLGGDEFVALLEDVSSMEDGLSVARKMAAVIPSPLPSEIGGGSAAVGASVGVSFYPDDGADLEALLSAADAAMYEAKRRSVDLASRVDGPVAVVVTASDLQG